MKQDCIFVISPILNLGNRKPRVLAVPLLWVLPHLHSSRVCVVCVCVCAFGIADVTSDGWDIVFDIPAPCGLAFHQRGDPDPQLIFDKTLRGHQGSFSHLSSLKCGPMCYAIRTCLILPGSVTAPPPLHSLHQTRKHLSPSSFSFFYLPVFIDCIYSFLIICCTNMRYDNSNHH